MSISAQFRADFWDSGLVVGTLSQQEEGKTKYEQKQELREKGITSFHEIAKYTNIRQSTAKEYIGTLKEMGNYLKTQGKCLDEKNHFDVKLITADHVYNWLAVLVSFQAWKKRWHNSAKRFSPICPKANLAFAHTKIQKR